MLAEIREKLKQAEAIAGPAPVIGERAFRPTHTYLTQSGRAIPVEAVPESATQRWDGVRLTVLTGRGDVWECNASKLSEIGGAK
jgi:hypothetical protein